MKTWSLAFLLLSFGFFAKAHTTSGYENGKAKPNSLLYVLNGDSGKAYWTTYDKTTDEWTKEYLGEKPKKASLLNKKKLYSKYGSQYTLMADAPKKNIAKPSITFAKDSVIGNKHFLKIIISPNRNVNRYDVFVNNMTIQNLKANGVKSLDFKTKIGGQASNKLLSYYVVNNEPLVMEFTIPAGEKVDMDLVESSFDLMSNPMFKMTKRKNWMMPTPFVLNDAVVITQKIKPTLVIEEKRVLVWRKMDSKGNTTTVGMDSLGKWRQ